MRFDSFPALDLRCKTANIFVVCNKIIGKTVHGKVKLIPCTVLYLHLTYPISQLTANSIDVLRMQEYNCRKAETKRKW